MISKRIFTKLSEYQTEFYKRQEKIEKRIIFITQPDIISSLLILIASHMLSTILNADWSKFVIMKV